MDNENMLGAAEPPADVSELGELCSAELECPGVYHLAVRPETDHCLFPKEYYLVLDDAPISIDAREYSNRRRTEMTDRIMLRAYADTHTIAFRTVSARMKPPQRFLICYEEFDRLRENGHIISSDIRSFAKIRIDEDHDGSSSSSPG